MQLRRTRWVAVACVAVGWSLCASAQLSLSTAIDMALRNSPQVRMAQADVTKSRAAYAQAVAAYIPSVTVSGGIGKSAGVPLSLPVIFTISAQSLAFNFSQPDYIRAAKSAIASANFSLDAARETVVEDTVSTYVTLDNAQRRKSTLGQIGTIAGRLQQIADDRYAAGADAHSEVTKARRTAVQIQLQRLQVNDEIETLADHLSHMTDLPASMMVTLHESIPQMRARSVNANAAGARADSYSVQAAFANAQSRAYQAHGDKRYQYLPQFAFGAGYSRISTVGTSYTDYYPGFATNVTRNNQQGGANSLNSLDVGIQISVPILDYLPLAAVPLLLAGPPGAGKTLSVARLATRLVMAGQSPMIITTDGRRAGATEQLAAFTRLLGLTLIVASHPATLARALLRRTPGTPVLIDAPGTDPFDPASRDEIAGLASTAGATTVLVLPAGLDPAEVGGPRRRVRSIRRQSADRHAAGYRAPPGRRAGGRPRQQADPGGGGHRAGRGGWHGAAYPCLAGRAAGAGRSAALKRLFLRRLPR